MPTENENIGSHTLGNVLSRLDAKRQSFDLELRKVISSNAQTTELTYAEVILLVEGSQTGTADCTIPPYVLYEADLAGTVADTCIRSEVLEWCLDSKISQSLLKSGFLEIEGATILSSLEFNADEKVSLTDNKDENNRDERFSLDLDNKSISVDFYCTRCEFSRGITLADSYTENLIFDNVRIGKSYIANREVSFNATNASIVGDLKFISKPGQSPSRRIRQDSSILGMIIIDRAKIDGSLQITNNKSEKNVITGIQADYLQAKIVDFSFSLIKGDISLDYSTIEQAFLFISGILKGKGNPSDSLRCTYSQCQLFDLRGSHFDCPVYLYLSQIDKLICSNSKFYGQPHSLNASGIKSKTVLLQDGFFALHGVMLFKSEVELELDCRGGFFGFSLEKATNGIALSFRNSKAQNAYFSDGFVSLGQLDISSAIIDNLYFRRGLFIDPYENNLLPKEEDFKTYAIYASNCKINQRISFNPSKGSANNPKINKLSENYKEEIVSHRQRIYDVYRKLLSANPLQDSRLSSEALDYQAMLENVNYNKLYADKSVFDNFNREHKAIADKFIQYCEHCKSKLGVINEEETELKKVYDEIEDKLKKLEQEFNNEEKEYSKKLEALDEQKEFEKLNNDYSEFCQLNSRSKINQEVSQKENKESIKLNIESSALVKKELEEEYIFFNSSINVLYRSFGINPLNQKNLSFSLGFSLFSAYRDLKDFFSLAKNSHHLKNTNVDIDKFALIYGEAFFEEVKVDGEIDCAGAIFYRKSVPDNVNERTNVRKNDWKKWMNKPSYEEKCDNALTLSHAKVDGTLYLNSGDGINQLSFLARGEVDLQHSSFKQLSITPSLARAKGTRWNLIGATYDDIYAQPQYEKKVGQPPKVGSFNKVKQWLKKKLEIFKNTAANEDLKSCNWIYPYYRRENFRQPYEQLANTLFKNGEDVSARRVIVSKTPSRNSFEAAILTAFVRLPFRLGFPVQRAVALLLLLALSGIFIFRWGHNENLITQSDLTKAEIVSEDADSKEIPFNSIWYSFQKLMPLVNGEQEENFTATYEKNGGTLKQCVQELFYAYYNLYSLSGAFLIAMILLSLARMRKNSS